VYHFSAQAKIKFRPEAVSHQTEHAFDYSPGNGKSVSGSGLLGKEHAARFRDGMARPSNVIEAGTGGAKVTGAHPAEFPVALPRWFLLAYSDPGDVLYDPFVGSGTSLLAAAESGRVGCGIEIAPRYCAVVLERLAAAGLLPRLG
jgi:DNA modification methylase